MLQIPPEWYEKLYESLPLEFENKEAGNAMGLEKLKDTPTFGKLYRDGKAEGKKEGKIEAQKSFARKLLRMDYSDEEISQLTELEMEEVKQLRESLGH